MTFSPYYTQTKYGIGLTDKYHSTAKAFSLFMGGVYFVYMFIFYLFTDYWQLVAPMIVSVVINLSCYFLLRKNNLSFVKFIVFLTLIIDVAAYDIMLGKESYCFLAFFTSVLVPPLFFNKIEGTWTTIGLTTVLIFFGFSIVGDSIIQKLHFANATNQVVNYSIALAIMIMTLTLTFQFIKSSGQLEAELKMVNDNLKEDQNKLELQKRSIENNQTLLNSIIESANYEQMFAVDKSLNVLTCNKQFLDVIKRAEIPEGNPIFDLLPPTQKFILEPIIRTALSGRITTKKIKQKVSNKSEITLELKVTPLRSQISFEIIGAVVFYTNIDDAIKLEEAIQEKKIANRSLRFKSEFLAQMSHEIRTPLNGIIGMVDVLESTEEFSAQGQSHIDVIKQSSGELLHLINSVLDLSKLEAGKFEVTKKEVELEKLFSSTLSVFSVEAKRKNIELSFDLASSLPKVVITDGGKLKQILYNLISNAVKFTPEGKVSIEAKTVGNDIQLEIKDTGVGLSESDQKKLFNKYEQIHSTIVRKIDGSQMGTGLGLAITQELVQLLKGNISVESTPGKGTAFTVKIPLEVSPTIQVQKTDQSNSTKNKFKKNILLVEDKKVNITVATLLLKSIGCSVDVAMNGEECLLTYKENEGKYDLILMDIQMPIMDGLTATQELKRNFNNLPPIVALSANNMEGDREKYLSFGLDDYIAKPINKEIILENFNKYFKDPQ